MTLRARICPRKMAFSLFWKSLDGIAEHCPGHDRVQCCSTKTFQDRLVALADLAEHPAGRLVDQVFPVAEQALGDPESVGKIPQPDEVKRSRRC